MATIKIKSNPYERKIEYLSYKEQAAAWEEIQTCNPNSKLREDESGKSFLPFKIKEIVDIILDEYQVGNEKVNIVFEGTQEEYEELEKICTMPSMAEKIVLTKANTILENAKLILSDTKEIFKTVDGQSDSQAGGAGNEVSVNSNNSGSDNASGNSSGNSSDSGNQSAQPDNGSDSGNQSAQPDNSSDNSGELSGGSGSDASANTTFKADGTYTGSAVCETYNYNVMVTIVISGDTITSVTAESEAGAQDVQYFNMANVKVPAQLLANQSTSGVDAVSGATKSSNAIKKAFYYAYKSAKK